MDRIYVFYFLSTVNSVHDLFTTHYFPCSKHNMSLIFLLLFSTRDILVVGKLEGKRLLGKHRCRWEDNIRMDLREIGWERVD